MNFKNIACLVLSVLEAINIAFPVIPIHGALVSVALALRSLIDQFWPAQSNVDIK